MATKVERAADKAGAIETLRRMLPIGAAVYTQRLHSSKSGASHRIAVFAVVNGEIYRISGLVGRALDVQAHAVDGAITIRGGGMDMGFHVVYSLALALHNGAGGALTQRAL